MNSLRLTQRLAMITAVCTFAACATVTEEDRAQVADVRPITTSVNEGEGSIQPNSDANAQLTLFRRWNGEGLLFLGTGPKVEIDGREVGRCLLGEGTVIELAPGEHIIRAPHSEISARPFRTHPGQTLFVECKYTVGALVPNVEFEFHADRN